MKRLFLGVLAFVIVIGVLAGLLRISRDPSHSEIAEPAPRERSDADISRLLVGRWVWRPTSKLFIDITFVKGQSFTALKGFGDFGYEATGTWKVETGDLLLTTKKARIADQEVEATGSSSKWPILQESKVVSISKSILVLRNDGFPKEVLEFKKTK